MKMYNCLIVDDEPLARKGLKEFVSRNPTLLLLGEARSALEAREMLTEREIDILFLDIEMPRVSGIELLESKVADPAIIITSAYNEYAVKGFELNVQDYLLKPFSYDRFCRAVEKAQGFLKNREPLHIKHVDPIVFIRSEGILHKMEIKDLVYIEAMQNYMICHTEEGRIIAHITMKALEEQLPGDRFVRTHKSYLVNISKILRIEGNEAIVKNARIPISRIFKEAAVGKIIGDQLLNRG